MRSDGNKACQGVMVFENGAKRRRDNAMLTYRLRCHFLWEILTLQGYDDSLNRRLDRKR